MGQRVKYEIHDSLEGRDTVLESRLVVEAKELTIKTLELRINNRAYPETRVNIHRQCALHVFEACRSGGPLPHLDDVIEAGLARGSDDHEISTGMVAGDPRALRPQPGG